MGRARHYRNTFSTESGKAVLRDLARFCHAQESTFHDNERVQAKLDGYREVWLRISSHLNLTEEQLWDMYDGRYDQEGDSDVS
jgi:hypothetical protein